MDANVIPRVLMGTVDGIEIVGVGTLELARNVLLRTVSGAANVGAEALTATTAGARRAVLAAAPKTSRSGRRASRLRPAPGASPRTSEAA
jgi:hypothetical protein